MPGKPFATRLLALVVAGALAVPAVLAGSVRPARADETVAPDPDLVRRRVMWGAVAFSGTMLVTGFVFWSRYSDKVQRFNELTVPGSTTPDGRCGVHLPNHGPPGCADLLASAERSKLGAQVGWAMAGAAAVTALTLKLLEPAAPPPRPEGWELACAPLLGAGATCSLRF